jgi:ATP-dependent helicase/nuclease subunit A
MSGPRLVPDGVTAPQSRASDPELSVFVSANAGSGKTHVLVRRVVRLLLKGVAPEKILCITFTKAAAANMAQRVFTTLGHWITLDDAALDATLVEVGVTPGSAMRRRARELFACALETPGGLKVQTIHALCTRLLQQFPFEAGVPARFAVLDDRDQSEMMERASLQVLLQAAEAPESDAGRALTIAMTSAADVTFRDVVREAVLSRDHFQAWTETAGSVAAAQAQLAAALGLSPDDSLAAIEAAILDGPHLPRRFWGDAITGLQAGSKSDLGQAERLRNARAARPEEQVEAYLDVFLTAQGEPRKTVFTKALAEAAPGLAARLDREATRLLVEVPRRRAALVQQRTAALLAIAAAVAANYRAEKQERGLLDYDDLIDRTLAMLERTPASWVHFKLDQGVDHVLIDEAQDTSPRQWEIISHLVSEFTAGAGARPEGLTRTVFAVGDEKQSIFSFQGAAPREFDARRRDFEKRFIAAGHRFEKVNFTYSFRSGEAVLRSVEAAFSNPEIYRSITSDADGMPPHMALADAAPASIELWELEQPNASQELEGWQAPFDAVAESSPEARLAARIRDRIRQLVADGTATGPLGRRRPLRYGDVLVLVRRRGRTFNAIIQALKQGSIPVAGADRLKLTEHVAVIDLMNLADALLFARDDLALAVALKSPLFGISEEALYELAFRRTGSLRDALRQQAATNPRLADVQARLEACAARARGDTPFGFYAWLLGGDGGRARMLARLGHEANDALDEFLELALAFERRGPASLQGFMAWLRAADTEIKRDMEISRDEVRVMTVHGSKGLEAPVVFLADTTSSPTDSQRLALVRLPPQPQAPRGCVVWAGRRSEDPAPVAAARGTMVGETEDEYRRLLYVAMTRAADRLIVGGIQPGNRSEVRPNSWYDLIRKGLDDSELELTVLATPRGEVRCYGHGAVETAAADAAPVATEGALPGWLHRRAAPDAPATITLTPSAGEDSAAAAGSAVTGETLAARQRARIRGTTVHRLLQALPEIEAPARAAAAASYLARKAADWSETERDALVRQVLALVASPDFRHVFAPGSRAEVAIVGRLPRPGRPAALVSGQIDRLAVTDREVLIVDFKTNHAPPRRLADCPPAYRRQLALYRGVLAALHPEKVVRAALIWTETAEIMEIPAPDLDAELTRALAGSGA